MEQTEIRAIKRDDGVWINADDMLKTFDVSIAEYRRIAATYGVQQLRIKFNAFADAIQAERDDLASTIKGA